MNTITKIVFRGALVAMLLGLSACAPEVGSDKWCTSLEKKSKGDWSANEVGNYAKYCIFK